MSHFVLMLTLDDETIHDALDRYRDIADTGIRYVGFKDIGIPERDQHALVEEIRANGHTSVLEVVNLSPEGERSSAESAVRMGVDYLVGGTRIEETQRRLEGSEVRYMPYVGNVSGHPAILEGRPDDIVDSARAAVAQGVSGINLLAYRYPGDGLRLVRDVVTAVSAPVLSAGSIDSISRVRAICRAGVWGFTIGGAVVTRSLVEGTFRDQVIAVLDAVNHEVA